MRLSTKIRQVQLFLPSSLWLASITVVEHATADIDPIIQPNKVRVALMLLPRHATHLTSVF